MINLLDICTDPSGYQIFGFLGIIINIITIIVPILIVVMGTVDLAKAIIAQKEDELKKGYSILIKRIILGVFIFFLPSIVGMIISLAGGTSDCKSANCVFTNSYECVSNAKNKSALDKLEESCLKGEYRFMGTCIKSQSYYGG